MNFKCCVLILHQKIEYIKNPIQIEKLNAYLRNGAKVYVISASIEEWIKPWCQKYGVQNVLGTKIEIDLSGKLIGDTFFF